MIDDERIGALFRDAAAGPAPAPGFDHAGVVAASRRVTARRRSAAAAGALGLVAVVGVGVVTLRPAAEDGPVATAVAPESARDAAGGSAGGFGPPPAGPGAVPGPVIGPATGDCADQQDPALRALVAAALPEVAAAPPAPTTSVCLPGAHRYLHLAVQDAGVTGVLDVGYLPPGETVVPAPGGVVLPTASGGTVLVGSTADRAGAVAPFGSRLWSVAAALAARL